MEDGFLSLEIVTLQLELILCRFQEVELFEIIPCGGLNLIFTSESLFFFLFSLPKKEQTTGLR